MILAFKLNMPDEDKVKVDKLPAAFRIFAPLAMVKLPLPFCVQPPKLGQTLPLTSRVTLLFSSAPEIILAAAKSITKSMGSKSQLPFLPLGALVFTIAFGASVTVPLELVSTKPPLPEIAPPMALSVPATEVCTLDQIAMMPPLPFWVADTSIFAPSATVTVWARVLFCAALLAFALTIA